MFSCIKSAPLVQPKARAVGKDSGTHHDEEVRCLYTKKNICDAVEMWKFLTMSRIMSGYLHLFPRDISALERRD